MNNVTLKTDKKDAKEIKAGSIWKDSDGEIYMLCTVGVSKYQAISLQNGNRFQPPSNNPQQAVTSGITGKMTYVCDAANIWIEPSA